MNLNVKIKEIMSTNIVVMYSKDLMEKAKEIFEKNEFHHIPVLSEDTLELVGIISKHDYNKMLTTYSIFKNTRADLGNRKFMMSLMAKDVMTKDVAKLHPDNELSTAVGIFKENLFHCLPIVDEDNKVVGMLSTFDLLNYAFDEKKNIELVE